MLYGLFIIEKDAILFTEKPSCIHSDRIQVYLCAILIVILKRIDKKMEDYVLKDVGLFISKLFKVQY